MWQYCPSGKEVILFIYFYHEGHQNPCTEQILLLLNVHLCNNMWKCSLDFWNQKHPHLGWKRWTGLSKKPTWGLQRRSRVGPGLSPAVQMSPSCGNSSHRPTFQSLCKKWCLLTSAFTYRTLFKAADSLIKSLLVKAFLSASLFKYSLST